MKILCHAAVFSIVASSALAGGYTTPTVSPDVIEVEPAGTDWTGFYAGVQYGQGDLELDYLGLSASEDFDAYGLHAGYMRDFGRFVLGGELTLDRLDPESGSSSDGNMLRLRGRLGADMGRVLPYATLGLAFIDDDESESTFTYGIGVDVMVSERFTLGLEYSRAKFDDVLSTSADLDMDLVQIRASYRF